MSNHSDITIMNTGTTANLSKPITNEYIADDYYTGALIFERGYVAGSGKFFTVPSEVTNGEEPSLGGGKILSVVHDSGLGYRRGGEARLVGWVGKDGAKTGTVPTRAVPVYVFK